MRARQVSPSKLIFPGLALALFFAILQALPAGAKAPVPGTAPTAPAASPSIASPSLATVAGLTTTYQAQGRVGYSSDGLGQNGTGGLIQAEVPAGSTVLKAFLYGTYFTPNPDLAGRTIDFDGTSVVTTKIAEVGGFLATTRADVTAQVATKVGSGGGITDFAVNNDPSGLDGVALVVVFSNPTLPVGTIAIVDGGASQTGDTFFFNLAAPLDKTVPGFRAIMSLGSGFSAQSAAATPHACGGSQFSIVDVNAQRLTTCAGNWDDGLPNNGALITVGGVGDDTLNPPTPTGPGGNDDELYNIASFLNQGDTVIRLDTSNPSQDDNLFLAVFSIGALATFSAENCTDGFDNDGDGLIDGADPDCIAPTTTTYTGGSSVQYSDSVALSGTLNTTGPVGVAGKQLDFTLGTQNASASPTDASGNASTSLVVTQTPSSVTTVATAFAGDSAYAASNDSDPFAINKEDCTLSYTGDTLVNAAVLTNLKAQFGELDASPGDWSGKSVTFTVTDAALVVQTFTATTNAAGVASTVAALGPNVYAVAVSFATDAYYLGCGSSTDTLVTVQDARAKITGGGWISQGTGNTNFGFNVIRDVTGLKGQLQVRSRGGKDRFHSTSVLTLNTSGNSGTWTGTGRWNNVDGYTFTVSVVDAGTSGKKGDTISIVIKSPANATVFNTGGPSPLKGGNIVVH